jgi:FkbM family methyltransferase
MRQWVVADRVAFPSGEIESGPMKRSPPDPPWQRLAPKALSHGFVDARSRSPHDSRRRVIEIPIPEIALMNEVLDLLRDSKHIADIAPDRGASRLALWKAYLRLKARRLRNHDRGKVTMLGYHVRYFDAANFAQLFREIFVNRLYDVPLASDAPKIIDCGSNIGMSILFFKNLYPKASIVGFEPNPLTFPTLRENIERNALSDVALYQKALSDRPGTIEFFVKEHEPGALDVGMFAGSGATSVTVQAVQLSSYIDGEVDLLKLDIEGAEELVLTDLAKQNKLRHVRNIVCEYHHHHRRDSGSDRLSDTLGILEKAGFSYQLDAYCGPSGRHFAYQDVLIYAKRKAASTMPASGQAGT